MGVEQDIVVGLFDRLEAAGLGYSIAYPNVNFSGDKPYLRCHVLQVPTRPYGVSAGNVHEGMIQIDAVVARGVGDIDALVMAEAVKAVYPRLTRIVVNDTTINIDTVGSVGPGIPDGDRYFRPVTISYKVFN